MKYFVGIPTNESSNVPVTYSPPTIGTIESPTTTKSPMIFPVTNPPTSTASKNTDPVAGVSTQISASSSPVTESTLISNRIGPAVGGAVGGLIAVIVVIAVVVIALLVIKRSQKGSLKVNNRKESVQGYNNALYDGKQTL